MPQDRLAAHLAVLQEQRTTILVAAMAAEDNADEECECGCISNRC